MFELRNFTLRDMSELGSALRRLGDGAHAMQEVADRTVRFLYENLVDERRAPGCTLVRFFKTHAYEGLDPELQAFARGMLGEAPRPGVRCLTLLASIGERSAWNSPRTSVGHRAIPLASQEMVSQIPMISSLLQQLGVEVDTLLNANSGILVEPEPSSFNVFYVPEAHGSPYIPVQEAFVEAAGVRSVLGFGGMLPLGDMFVVILFSKLRIPRETAELFRTLALNVKTAVLPFEAAVFAGPRGAAVEARDSGQVEMLGLKARIATLEQLLEVYENSVSEQSQRLYAEQQRLGFQKTLLECQGEASIDGLLSVGVDGTILFANRRLSEMWGIPAPRVGSKSYELVLQTMARSTADPARFLARWTAEQAGGEGREEVILRDGRVFDQYTAPIRDQRGVHLGRVWHFRDVSAVKEMDRVKDEFVSSVSHELRTPLTSIRGSLDLLAGGVMGSLPPEAAGVVDVARKNCLRVMRLINDVLDLEKIEAGRMAFRLEVKQLAPLLEQSVEAIRPYGDQLGVGFRIEDGAAGIRVRVDPDRLLQVLENLLSNAAKFSPPGGTVVLSTTRSGPAVRVSVSDRGPGVAPDLQNRLFEKFAQSEAAGARRKGGTGLGLNIARAIVERLGGRIGFASVPGVGATFHFDLPESDRPESATTQDRPPEPER